MYLGLTLFDIGETHSAVMTLKSFINLSGWDEQRYDAWIWIGKKTGDLDAFFNAIKERPDYPMAYFEIADYYLGLKKYKKANEFYKMGFSKGRPDTALGINPRSLDLIPLFNQSEVLFHLGDIKGAISNVDKCLAFYPEDLDLLEKKTEYDSVLADSITVRDTIKRLKRTKDKKTVEKIISNIPEHLQGDPVLARAINTLIIRKWEDDEICIFAPSFIEPWSPDSLETGIGGSEEAIIRLSRELRDKGKKVTVYTNTIRGNYDGVIYRTMEEFNHNDEFNLLVLWRCPYELDNKFKAKQVWLWLHDVHEPEDFTDYRITNVDKVIVLSKYHRSLFPMIPEEKIMYSSNGLTIDYDLYKDTKRDPYKMIWTSCPSRGLEHLLDMWPEIKKAVPKANLHVFYGFGNFEYAWKDDPEKMKWVAEMKEKLTQDGITYYGRTGQDEINRHTAESGVWAYPTEFPEISCITAMKAQSLGAIPVTTGFAALAETQKYGVKAPLSVMKEAIIDMLLKQKDFKRGEMMDWARKEFSWKRIAKEWIDATRTT
jgi:glycosyltransferase involved in cell wall biosynthesis